MQALAQVFLLSSKEIEALLADNNTDLVALLRAEGIRVERGLAASPATATGGTKEPVTVLLATAGLVLALTPALSKVLSLLSHKPIEVKEVVLVPVEDSIGHVVHDAQGQPLTQWVERSRLLSTKEPASRTQVALEGPLGLKLTYKETRE